MDYYSPQIISAISRADRRGKSWNGIARKTVVVKSPRPYFADLIVGVLVERKHRIIYCSPRSSYWMPFIVMYFLIIVFLSLLNRQDTARNMFWLPWNGCSVVSLWTLVPRKKPLLSAKTREVFSCFSGQNTAKISKNSSKQGLERLIRPRQPLFFVWWQQKDFAFRFSLLCKKVVKEAECGIWTKSEVFWQDITKSDFYLL